MQQILLFITVIMLIFIAYYLYIIASKLSATVTATAISEDAGVEIMESANLNNQRSILVDLKDYEELMLYKEMANNAERLEDTETNAREQ